MGFIVTQLFLGAALLSPAAFGLTGDELRLPLILALIALAVGVFYLPGSQAFRHQQAYLIIIWSMIACVSLIPVYITGALEAFRGLLPFIVGSILIVVTCRKLSYLTGMAYFLWAIAGFIVLQGILQEHAGVIGQYVMMENVSENIGGGTLVAQTLRIRGLGVIQDPNDFGQLLVCTLPLLWLRWKPRSHIFNFLFTLLPAAYLIYGIYLTRSRGTLVALLAVVIFAFKDRLSIFGSAILGVGALAGLLATGVTGGRGISEDDGSRVALWAQSISAFRRSPFIGIGLWQTTEITDTHQTAHNSYILSFTETGVLGYFFFVALLLSCWFALTKMMEGREARKKLAREEEVTTKAPWAMLPSEKPAPGMPVPTLAVAGPAIPASQRFLPGSRNAMRAPVLTYEERMAAFESSQAAVPVGLRSSLDVPSSPQQFEHAAFCIRLTMVGLLTSCMFLSRTYSLVLYIVVGMVAALVAVNPEPVSMPLKKLFRTTPVWVVGSIALLYVAIRVRGVR
ncbi:O-antigen ligase [Bryocella elongata]|uniref:O-antigen ligase n=1 Tax=Bryocella elongata TaxID=863522 RepID=A0A1H5XZY8_9BACT|nr:O-antigen ligase family protein [Bryocella elongata]SEG16930.1 O-antigen ligase [Bryocella elongata]